MAFVTQILIAQAAGSKMIDRLEARAVPGHGLEGDRYYAGLGTFSPQPQKPDFEMTLIEKEKIEAFAQATGLHFTAADARRNIVTEGVDLNSLVGKEFLLGEVLIRGIRLCEPCNYLAKRTFSEILRGLAHQGGIRAAILSEGLIRVGDKVVSRGNNGLDEEHPTAELPIK